jgi:hypothetical protein
MAMTRNALKAMGLNEEQIGSIIEMHTETVDGLKKQISIYKADAEKLPAVQKELDDLKKEGGEDWKDKYDAEKAAHEQTKSDYAAKETAAKIKTAYRGVLKEVSDTVLILPLIHTSCLQKHRDKEAVIILIRKTINGYPVFCYSFFFHTGYLHLALRLLYHIFIINASDYSNTIKKQGG